jgi:hypothetical protein
MLTSNPLTNILYKCVLQLQFNIYFQEVAKKVKIGVLLCLPIKQREGGCYYDS